MSDQRDDKLYSFGDKNLTKKEYQDELKKINKSFEEYIETLPKIQKDDIMEQLWHDPSFCYFERD